MAIVNGPTPVEFDHRDLPASLAGRLRDRSRMFGCYFVTPVGSRTPVNFSQVARNASWTGTSDAAA
jgi:hypothetical protein